MDACFYNTSRKRSVYIKKIETVAGGEGKGREMVDALAFKTRLINQRLFNFSEPLTIIRLSYFD